MRIVFILDKKQQVAGDSPSHQGNRVLPIAFRFAASGDISGNGLRNLFRRVGKPAERAEVQAGRTPKAWLRLPAFAKQSGVLEEYGRTK